MTDAVRAGPEGETPVNPYSLLEAVNNSSDTANTSWLIFLAIMAYFMIAVAGVTHKDLLLETPVALPIMQVSIQQSLFFQFAPVMLVLFHLGVVSQLALLARKTLEFDYAVRSLEVTDRRTHPLRLELHNFFFVQAIAGPHRSIVMSTFLHGMSWITLVILPVVLLLFIQISYLPFHDMDVTWAHRICLLLDVAMLILIGIFLLRAETSFFSAFWRTTVSNPISFVATAIVLSVVAFFSLFVATVPGEGLDRMMQPASRGDRQDALRTSRASAGFSVPFLRTRADGSLWGRFHRNIVVTDTDLVPDREFAAEETTLNLRNRDLRFAQLDRSDLHRADLTGADLGGASLVATDLRRARLQCFDLNELILSENRVKANCVKAVGANFTRAKLGGARLTGIDLRSARLEEANLEAADLSHAHAAGANFSSAQMDGAELTGGVNLQGANMLIVSLRGADLFGAMLQGADLSSASLQGAILSHAQLHGATLRDADMEGADLQYAYLQRSDFSGARIKAADLRGATIWQTSPPVRESLALADLGGLVIRPSDAEEAKLIRASLESIDNDRVKRLVVESIEPMLNQAETNRWGNSPERQIWQSYVTITQSVPQDSFAKDLTEHLTGLMCRARFGNGAVAAGIARRSQGAQFRGSLGGVYDRLRGKDCAASANMAPRLMQQLSAAVDTASGK